MGRTDGPRDPVRWRHHFRTYFVEEWRWRWRLILPPYILATIGAVLVALTELPEWAWYVALFVAAIPGAYAGATTLDWKCFPVSADGVAETSRRARSARNCASLMFLAWVGCGAVGLPLSALTWIRWTGAFPLSLEVATSALFWVFALTANALAFLWGYAWSHATNGRSIALAAALGSWALFMYALWELPLAYDLDFGRFGGFPSLTTPGGWVLLSVAMVGCVIPPLLTVYRPVGRPRWRRQLVPLQVMSAALIAGFAVQAGVALNESRNVWPEVFDECWPSPDGRWIALLAKGERNHRQWFIVNPRDGTWRRMPDYSVRVAWRQSISGVSLPPWSPDSRLFRYDVVYTRAEYFAAGFLPRHWLHHVYGPSSSCTLDMTTGQTRRLPVPYERCVGGTASHGLRSVERRMITPEEFMVTVRDLTDTQEVRFLTVSARSGSLKYVAGNVEAFLFAESEPGRRDTILSRTLHRLDLETGEVKSQPCDCRDTDARFRLLSKDRVLVTRRVSIAVPAGAPELGYEEIASVIDMRTGRQVSPASPDARICHYVPLDPIREWGPFPAYIAVERRAIDAPETSAGFGVFNLETGAFTPVEGWRSAACVEASPDGAAWLVRDFDGTSATLLAIVRPGTTPRVEIPDLAPHIPGEDKYHLLMTWCSNHEFVCLGRGRTLVFYNIETHTMRTVPIRP